MLSYFKKFFLKGIIFYRTFISPLYYPTCRFVPTCSEYSYDAIERYGLKKGLFLTVKRILRCHPLAKGGYDPLK